MSLVKTSHFAIYMTLLVTGCAAPIRMHEAEPRLPATVPGYELADGTVRDFKRLSMGDSLAATGVLLDGIRSQQDRIASGDESVIPSYNYLVSRLVKHLELCGIDPWETSVTFKGSKTTYTLSGREPAGFGALKRELVPADTIAFTGKYSRERVVKPGIGAPLIAQLPDGLNVEHITSDEHFEKRYHAATALVRVSGNKAVIELLDPHSAETVSFAGKQRPLAADFGSAACLAVCRDKIDSLGIARLFNPSRYANTAYLSPLQPYDPQRMPVLLIHGLESTPATWIPMYLALMKDPVIRKHYQFWVFSYPSGYPYPYSAILLRRELARMRRDHPGHKDIVLAGHSMGGVISRMMVVDAGDKIWRGYFGKPPSETKLSGNSRRLLEEAFVFNHVPGISRVIFLSAPHGGSELATHWIGRTASKLVRTPAFIANVRNSAVSLATADEAGLQLGRAPNSIDTLAPNDRFVRSTVILPIHPGIAYHSIMGDRGKGDTPDSSDGVVPYWSSRLDGAVSEKIVPSGHGSHQNPEGIEEVRRVLHLHLKNR